MAVPVGLTEDEAKLQEEIANDLDKKFRAMPPGDTAALRAKLREEAMQPTRDAVDAALACGISAQDLKDMVDAAAELRADGEDGLAVPWYKMPKTLDPTPVEVRDAAERAAARMRAGSAAGLSDDQLDELARAKGISLPPKK